MNGEQLNPGAVFWLEQALAQDPGQSCPPLAGATTADVCIVGGGYTGLWTAIEIKQQAPETDVVLLEAQGCGFGASGRNAGWMTSWFDELDGVVERWGEESGLWLADETSATIERIGAFVEEHGIDCHYRQSGSLWVASAPPQIEVIREAADAARRLGRGHLIEDVDAAEIERRTASPRHLEGIFITDGATVQPALLARGLRRVALELGVRIHEGSAMVKLERTSPAKVITPAGVVEAGQVVIASNAWAAQLRELRRSIFVVGSQMLMTEPVAGIEELPWSNGELFGDARMFVHAVHVTPEGRILFGRGGGAAGAFNRVTPKHFYDPAGAAAVERDFRAWFPQYADVRITHAWGGAVDRAPGHLPFVGALGDHENVHYGLGYSGNGVGPSGMVGRILGRRALGIEDEYTRSAIVSGPPGYLPPEPLRFAGGVLVREVVRRAEEREEAGGRVGPHGKLAKKLVTFSLPPSRAFAPLP